MVRAGGHHANIHVLRKGSGTHVIAATPCPPPISSIDVRSEWSTGNFFDVCWTLAEPGGDTHEKCARTKCISATSQKTHMQRF